MPLACVKKKVWLHETSETCSTAFLFISIDKLHRHGLSNTARHTHQAMILKLMLYYPWKEACNYLAVARRRRALVIKVSG